MKTFKKIFRKFLRLFSTDELSLKGEAYRICFAFCLLIFIGTVFAFFLGEAEGPISAIHWSIRVLFEDFGGLEGFPREIYPIAFVLKLSGHMIVPLFITLLTAKVLSIHFFKPHARHLKNHLIVCGKISQAANFLQQISQAGREDIVFLSALEGIRNLPLETRAVFLKPTADISLDLIQANVQEARVLLIVPNPEENLSDFESRAVMTIVAAKSLHRKIYILLESPFEEKVDYLKNLGVDEIISLGDLLPSMVSGCLSYESMASFLTEIITLGNGNGLSMEKLPAELEGEGFAEAMFFLKEKKNWLLLGIKRGDKVLINPWKLAVEKEDLGFVLKEE